MVNIVRAKRTAIGKYNGMYKDVDLIDLGANLLKEISKDLKIDEIILGNVLGANKGQNIARQISIRAGLDLSIPSFVVNKVCGSSLKSVCLGAQSIKSNDNELVLVGGIEKMTDSEYMIKDGLTCAINEIHMGITSENIVKKYGFSREELDDFAYLSQQRVKNALEKGYFSEEIFDDKVDEYPRLNLEREKLSTLKAAFLENGNVTAGNSSGINDGAAMLILASDDKVKELNLEVMAKVIGYVSVGNDPKYMGLAPIYSCKKLMKKYNLSVDEVDLFEINEAFSSVALAFQKELNIPIDKLNVNGGAIALGHPIGASGARVLVSTIYELKRKNLKRAIISLCIGGGQGISVLIER